MVLDWNSTTNILPTEADAQLHMQGRLQWYNHPRVQVSTAYAAYFFQGACDPSATNAEESTGYYPNCTAANNDLMTGGVVAPSPVNYFLATKAQDVVFALKSLYEAHDNIKQLGIYFFNAGAGSYIKFPATNRDAQGGNYTSAGCDWLRSHINPLTREFIATQQELDRCKYRYGSAFGTTQETGVPVREYNPLERDWFSRQAMAPPGQVVTTGPYRDSSALREDQDPLWVLTIGHPIYDRLTKEVIGCTLLDVSVDSLEEILQVFTLGVSSSVALVRWTNIAYGDAASYGDDDDGVGIVLGCVKCSVDRKRVEPYHITELQEDFGVDEEVFQGMLAMVNYSAPWEPQEVKGIYSQTLFQKNGQLVMIYPINLPQQYDPDYRPEFMIVMSISEDEIFGKSDDMDDMIWSDIKLVVRNISLIGVGGLAIILIFLIWIARSLSKPLMWMQATTSQVINNAGQDDLVAGTDAAPGGNKKEGGRESRWAPRTEVTVLLSEFEMMMDMFSGKGTC